MTVLDRPDPAALVIARLRASQMPPPGERRRLRRAAGATLQDISDATGASVPAASCWERGIYAPSRRYRTAYLALLDEFAAIAREKDGHLASE